MGKKINWSDAPDGATHSKVRNSRWYKLAGGVVYVWSISQPREWLVSEMHETDDLNSFGFVVRNKLPEADATINLDGLHQHRKWPGVEQGRKDDSAKELMHLIPAKAEMALARVLTFGAKKYAPENWRKVDNPTDRYMAAAMRHMNAHRQGELRDEESGELHLSHALTCLSFLVELLETGNEKLA